MQSESTWDSLFVRLGPVFGLELAVESQARGHQDEREYDHPDGECVGGKPYPGDAHTDHRPRDDEEHTQGIKLLVGRSFRLAAFGRSC